MKPTIKDVAREAAVSIATVSRVINRLDKVKDSTRQAIEAAIQKLDYKPDLIARTMIKKESRGVGLIIPTLTNEYWASLSEVIQEELWKRGYTLMLCSVHSDEANKGAASLKTFAERKMDGIIIGAIRMDNEETRQMVEWFIRAGIPIVTFEQRISGACRVTGDNMQGAVEGVQHLLRLGHKSIAYIHGTEQMDDRELGYRKALSISGIGFDDHLVVRTGHDKHSGYEAAKELLRRNADFTGLFCWNDSLALGAMRALLESGIRIPRDVSVVGYDNVETAGFVSPSLTTVELPAVKIGTTLVELLVESINTERKDRQEKSISYPLKLVERESCTSVR